MPKDEATPLPEQHRIDVRVPVAHVFSRTFVVDE
jgi:hypothetical protein